MTTSPSTAKKKTSGPSKSLGVGPGVGDAAPVFDAVATGVGRISHQAFLGHTTILYFYPKDDTSGCTAEACAFQEALSSFKKLGVNVIGVSKDSLAKHEKFAAKYNLTFPLISDEEGQVCAAFGTWVQKSMYGRSYMGIERSTFIIDKKGVIRFSWRKVSVPGHVEAVTVAVKECL